MYIVTKGFGRSFCKWKICQRLRFKLSMPSQIRLRVLDRLPFAGSSCTSIIPTVLNVYIYRGERAHNCTYILLYSILLFRHNVTQYTPHCIMNRFISLIDLYRWQSIFKPSVIGRMRVLFALRPELHVNICIYCTYYACIVYGYNVIPVTASPGSRY